MPRVLVETPPLQLPGGNMNKAPAAGEISYTKVNIPFSSNRAASTAQLAHAPSTPTSFSNSAQVPFSNLRFNIQSPAAAAKMPPRVRRTPFMERVKSMLNPMDMMLWIWEELETRDLASESVGTQAGLFLNIVFLIARANYGTGSSDDDIFSDDTGSGWLDWIVSPTSSRLSLA